MASHEQNDGLAASDPRARPLYTLREAAGYLGVPVTTLHSWGRPSAGRPLFTIFVAHGRQPSIPFIGLAEAFVVAAAKRAGVPDHRIRPNVEEINRELGIAHALAHKRVFTDGAELLVRLDNGSDLEVPRLKQQQLTATVKNQLRLITYADDGMARRLVLPKYGELLGVSIDPLVASGRPLLRGARVKDLLDRSQGGDSKEEIAAAFGLTIASVQAIVGDA